ncbi:MAG: KH domain-containing protein [Clostridia bacterium]|nr:KH domain-containing protein [Clostridia bacterium]
MNELVEFIVKQLVGDKDSVTVTSAMEGDTEVITVKVADKETGKIIGKKGKIASAIRTIVKASANKQNKKCVVEIID